MNRNDLKKDVRNLTQCFRMEIAWKRGNLRNNPDYLRTLADNGPKAREICGGNFVDLCRSHLDEHGLKPSFLDVGCGPVSSFAYLAHEGLAELIGVDPLASHYEALMSSFGMKSPADQHDATGESLTEIFPDRQFDVVVARNALDHHQCPPLAWLRMFEKTRVGGSIAHSHSIREATKEGWKQLHQYDLYPGDDQAQLWLEDSRGKRLCLTDQLPLQKTYSTATTKGDGTGWFVSVYRKTGEQVPAEFLAAVLEHLEYSLRKRHQWALGLESFILDLEQA